MKKSLIVFSLIFSFLVTSSILAKTNEAEVSQRQEGVQELRKALFKRYLHYRKNKQRTAANSNRTAQKLQHKISLAESSTGQNATNINRTGALKFVPYYVQRRGMSKLSSQVPNTAKRNFKVRAFDYYVEGGEAGRDVLIDNAYKSRDYQVKIKSTQNNPTAKNVAGIIKIMRKQQKYRARFSNAPSGDQETKIRTGDWRRNLAHPYMFGRKK